MKWLAKLLPLSARHRASCLATYAPVLVYLALTLTNWGAWDSKDRGQKLLVAIATLTGPLGMLCMAGSLWVVGLHEPLLPFVAFGQLIVPYFVIARHDVGTMPWPWFLALSTAWCSVCWWIWHGALAR